MSIVFVNEQTVFSEHTIFSHKLLKKPMIFYKKNDFIEQDDFTERNISLSDRSVRKQMKLEWKMSDNLENERINFLND